MGTWEWHISSGELIWSSGLGPILGLAEGQSPEDFEGFMAMVHPEDRDAVMASLRSAIDARADVSSQFRVPWRDGTDHWVMGRGVVLTDANGDPTSMIGFALDITEEKQLLESEQAARAEAEEAGDRLAFLAEATRMVSLSLSYKETLERITTLAVPRLADWCGVELIRSDRTSEWVAGVHVDPSKDDLIRSLRANYPTDMESDAMKALLSTGEGQLYPEVTDEMIEMGAKDERHAKTLRALGLTSVLVVPMTARGRIIGLLTLASSSPDRHFGERDLEFAGEIGRRCAIAVENSRLYEERAHIARILQRALLPAALPNIDGISMAASYLPAGEGNEVGGDFYDVFDTAAGSWGIVIGDVCGKGARAAALTGLARHTIRAAALNSPRPDDVLPVVNAAILHESGDSEFVTMAYGCLERNDDGGFVAWISRSGHPVPMVVRVDGRVEKIGADGALLGVFDDIDVEVDKVSLSVGDSIVFYTDGVLEARHDDDLFGEGRLVEVLEGCAGLDPETLTEKVEQAVLAFAGGARDDIAMLTLRVDDLS
jgi:PAS domain S-box-containing protein